MPATDEQVQNFVDQFIRPMAETTRGVKLTMDNIRATIDDVYEALANNPTWEDTRPDAPPHLLSPGDVLALNAFCEDMRMAMTNHSAYPIIVKACVRPI